jgi:uncharacterized membrane-anchored protein
MSLKIEGGRLDRIGGQCNAPDAQWATLSVYLANADNDHSYTATAEILVPKRADATLLELQETARKEAVLLFRKAADALEAQSVADLEAMSESALRT